MIVVENIFDVDKNATGQTSNLAEKSQKMVDAISQGLVETLKNELHECRNITENQRNRIKDLEREKESFLESQLALKHDGVSEMNELIDYLRKSVLKRNVSSNNDGNVTEITDLKIIKRNIDSIKKLIQNIRGGLDKAFKMVSSKSNEIVELRDNVKEMEEQMKNYAVDVEDLQEEKQFLNTKLNHVEGQHRLTIDELNTIQKRLKQVDSERKVLFDENTDMKGGKENMQDFCSNLSGENDKLLDNLKAIQNERDKLFEDLQEQMERVSTCTSDNNELERQCESLENIVTKLRREYQDQTREVNILTRENEEFKRSIQDSEQDRLKLRRNVKAVETGNKDLEDQIFQLTNDLQKLKSEHSKHAKNYEESANTIKELTMSMANSESEKSNLKNQLQDIIKQQKELQDVNRSLSTEVTRDKEMTEKIKTLLPSYEKLLIKLLHHRKELLFLLNSDSNGLLNVNLQLTSTQSIDYKNIEDIKADMEITAQEADATYDIVSKNLGNMSSNYKRYVQFLKELLNYTDNLTKPDDKYDDKNDSCYSTESDLFEPYLPGRDISDGRRGLKALKSKSAPKSTKILESQQFPPEILEKLLNEIKDCFSFSTTKNDKNLSVQRLDSNRKTMKKLQQLQRKLRKRNILEQGLRSKLSQLKKETNVLKTLHRSSHNQSQPPTSPKKSPVHLPSTTFNNNNNKLRDVLEELKAAERELEQVRQALRNCTDEPCKEKLQTNFENVDRSISSIRDNLVKHCGGSASTTDSNLDKIEEKFTVIKDQRQYMLEHLTFTNKRLEVLLNCLKGRETTTDLNNNQPALDSSSLNTRPLLRRVRKSFDDDVNAMKKAVSILELTKAISITDLTELDARKAINEEHRDVIVLVKDMNTNMESILREARSKITEAKVSKKDEQPKNGRIVEESERGHHHQRNKPAVTSSTTKGLTDEYIPKSELLKTENELKVSLENAQKKVEALSQFLQKRELELRERDVIIAKLNNEYERLKLQATDKNDKNIQTRDRIIEEYAKANKKLEQENEFLQVVVKELRDELLTFQTSFKKEEENQQHLQEFINELQICKSSLEKSLDKVAYELNIVKKDRDHLMRTLHGMSTHDVYQWYPADPHQPHMVEYSYDDPYYQPDCSMCVFPDYPESTTTFPFPEDDWASFCDDYESYPSDGEQDDVVSSSESAITSSRVAKTVKTLEATESIKSKNRPQKYLKQETRTRKPLLSPKISTRSSTHSQLDPFEGISFGGATSSSVSDYRVKGRRESNTHKTPQSPGLSGGRRSSIELNNTHRTSTSKPSSRSSSRPVSGNFEVPHSYQQQPVTDIDSAVQMATKSQDSYYEEKRLSARSPRDQLATPFLNQNFEKKKKKKFLPFRKK